MKKRKAGSGVRIVLASASPRRKELLLQIGIRADIMPGSGRETYAASTPSGIVRELSRKKAEEAAALCEAGTVVIGADTIVVKDGEVLGKPKSKADAARMLRLLSGGTHSVHTGVTILAAGGKRKTFSVRTDVSVYPLSESEITDYIETGEPADKAGAYGIQGRFAAYIRRIGGDYSNVVGLPLGRTAQELKNFIT